MATTTMKMHMLKITNLKTRQSWEEVNTNHSWKDFCLDLIKNHPDTNLVWSDIEVIVYMYGTWYILDECGNWAYIPNEEYSIKVIP